MFGKLLIPHVLACACLVAAFGWMRAVGHNRSVTDLYLAQVGSVFAVFAFVATVYVAGVLIVRRKRRREWPMLLLHVFMLGFILWLGFNWIGYHLA